MKFKFLKLFVFISSLTVILDQFTKILIYIYKPNFGISVLNIHLVKNTGAGFGILQNQTFLLGLISLFVAIGIISYYHKIPQEKYPQILVSLLLGGVIGNLIDRFFRKFVIDFIDFTFWPAFNIADAAITTVTIGLIVYYWKK